MERDQEMYIQTTRDISLSSSEVCKAGMFNSLPSTAHTVANSCPVL